MNKFLIGVILVIGFWLWWNRKTDQPPPPASSPIATSKVPKPLVATSKPAAAVSKPAIVAPAPPTQAPVLPTLSTSQSSSTKPKPPAKGLMEFEIKDGVAIAEGDIILGKLPDGQSAQKGVTSPRPTRLWPSNQIPYSIQTGVTQTQLIQAAINEIQNTTPVRFVPYKGEADSLVFVPSQELCASYLGKSGGGQPIYLAPNCGLNEIIHELMHALGFVHEHSRPDRDRYLEVLWDNIEEKHWPQFWVIPDELIHEYVGSVFSFDNESIMLYDPKAFAKAPDLVALKARSGVELKPSREHLSRVDQERVGYLYGQ